MDKSGEKWWKTEGKQWSGDMSWGIQKLGYRIEIRINFNDFGIKLLNKNPQKLLALGGFV